MGVLAFFKFYSKKLKCFAFTFQLTNPSHRSADSKQTMMLPYRPGYQKPCRGTYYQNETSGNGTANAKHAQDADGMVSGSSWCIINALFCASERQLSSELLRPHTMPSQTRPPTSPTVASGGEGAATATGRILPCERATRPMDD